MAIVEKTTLKGYFITGAKPTQAQFEDLIDSFLILNSENDDPADGIATISQNLSVMGKLGIGTNEPLGPLSIGDASVDHSDGFLVIGKKEGGGTRQFKIGFDPNFRFTIGDYGRDNVNSSNAWKKPFAIMYTAPDNSFYIDGTGKVGIGTGAPETKLHVAGDSKLAGTVTITGSPDTNSLSVTESASVTKNLTVGGALTSDSATITKGLTAGGALTSDSAAITKGLTVGGALVSDSATITKGLTMGGALTSDSATITKGLTVNGDLTVNGKIINAAMDSGTELTLGEETKDNGKLVVHGKVGIGIGDPSSKLHIEGIEIKSLADGQKTKGEYLLEVSKSVPGGLGPVLLINNKADIYEGNSGAIDFAFGKDVERNAPSFRIQSSYDTTYKNHLSFLIKQGSTNIELIERLRITSDGMVGIGTSDPKHTLHVDGDSVKLGGLSIEEHKSSSGNSIICTVDEPDPNSGSGTLLFFEVHNAADSRKTVNKNANPIFQLRCKTKNYGLTRPALDLYNNEEFENTKEIITAISFSHHPFGKPSTSTPRPGAVIAAKFPHEHNSNDSDYRSQILFYTTKANGELEERMIINHNGNVGIGTSTPGEKLEVAGNIFSTGKIIPSTGNNEANGIVFASDPGGGKGDFASIKYYVREGEKTVLELKAADNEDDHIALMPSGNVGIGTNNPTKGKLQVSGHGSNLTIEKYGYLSINDISYHGTQYNETHSYSIYAEERIAASEFNAYSDARIKNISGRSDSRLDLATLLRLRVTDYTMVDTVGQGTRPYKKIIGQELAEAFPQAISTITDVVPDIYKRATVQGGWIQLATDLKAGEKVKLITSNKAQLFDVAEVAAGRFRVSETLPDGEVFVYGREVSDFHLVDYEAIAMLNVSATQELYRQLEAQRKRLKALEAGLGRLEGLNRKGQEG